VSSREVRGEHAHRALHQLLICIHGECAVAIDDGTERGEVLLDRPDVALHLPPMVWGTQYRYSPDGVLLVLASDAYDPDDYIRDYDEFQRLVGDG
jgi:UDP-2-acetamido-3-amino-2,3-dideoxy-glucuronate N-acetyltransferase